ncbi:MAG TPA: SLC13 family permease [Thermoanaerobaculia bacterium]|nr:SLC13 family permease [Thermoanaerobaculia bacterium]
MTLPILLVLSLLVTAVLVFAFEWLPVDVTTLLLLVVLVLSGTLTFEEAFAGFASEIIIILASIFVLTGALMKTGVVDALGGLIHRVAGGSRRRILACVMGVTCAISAFINNTTTTAVMLPAVLGVCRRSKVSPSQVLIPLAFASILGGTCTLIGTSTNVAASGFLLESGLAPFTLFEFLPIGLVMVVAGTGLLLLFAHRLLPDREEGSYTEAYEIKEYLSEVVVPPGSPLAGKAIRDTGLAALGLTVLTILRGEQRLYPDPDRRLADGDLLIVQASREGLLRVKEKAGVEIKPDLKLGDEDLLGDTLKFVEAILMPQSALVGRTVEELDFRARFGVTVLAIYRRGHALARKLTEVALEVGDVLLLQGRSARFQAFADSRDLWVLQETEHIPARRRKGLYVAGLFVLAIAAAGLELIPLPIAFLGAALGVLLLRLVTPEEAYGSVDWRLLVLIAGMTAFGGAMKKTGAAEYLAGLVVDFAAPLGIYVVMAGFVVLTMLLTQPMSNAAAALVVLPVALSTAARLDVDPRSFAVLVTLAASLSLITPFEPSCLLVYGPGRYRFADFVRAGAPLTLIALVLLLLLVPVLWPLRP